MYLNERAPAACTRPAASVLRKMTPPNVSRSWMVKVLFVGSSAAAGSIGDARPCTRSLPTGPLFLTDAGSLQNGAVQFRWQLSSGNVGRAGSQPLTWFPSSQVSPSAVRTTASPQNVQSGRHVACGGTTPGMGVGSGGSQVSPASRTPFPQRGLVVEVVLVVLVLVGIVGRVLNVVVELPMHVTVTGMVPRSAPLCTAVKRRSKAPAGRPLPVNVTSKHARPPGGTFGRTPGVMPTMRPGGTVPPVVSAMSMGVVTDVWMAFTIASRSGPPPPPMSKTSGVPVPSTAPVRRPSADMKTDGSGDGPVLVVGAPPGAMPRTRTPAAFSAATTAGTGPTPEGTTAFGTVFVASDLASPTKPNRESPGESAQAKRLEGSLPPVPVMIGGTTGGANGATGQVSVARITSRREAGRNPAPPMPPEWGTPATSVENAGTSPLVSGDVWVLMFPAGCAPLIPVVLPLPSPSNPLPVATW